MPLGTKRRASRSPDAYSPRRRPPSSPEEGEVDDQEPSTSKTPPPKVPGLPPRPVNNKTKVPFPFKRKPQDRDEGDLNERKDGRPGPAVYERSEEDERRFREDASRKRRDQRAWTRGPGRGHTGDRYVPSLEGNYYEPSGSWAEPRSGWDSYHPDRYNGRYRDNGRGRSRERTPEIRRDWSKQRTRSHSREHLVKSPVSPKREVFEASSSRSPLSRDRTPSPASTSSRKATKHRLPTPRVSSTITPRREDEATLKYDEYPSYRERERDPRDQYHRDEPDDWDRYRPGNYHHDRDSRRSRIPKSPQTPPYPSHDPLSPPRNSAVSYQDGAQISVGSPPPPLPPSPDPGKNKGLSFRLPKRPGAPLGYHSPPSFVPPPVEPVIPSSSTKDEIVMKETRITKQRRAVVRRTREQEKEVYGKIFVGCGQKDDYEVMTKLGEGTFGEVHKAIRRQNKALVALKRILMHNEKEGMPVTALREIKILKALKHRNIVELLDMFVIPSKGKEQPMSVFMVFPYMDHDLAGLLENDRVKLSPSQIKLYAKQLLEGTEYMHKNKILHRDMKAANLLISNNGSLRIADFGLARAFDPSITTAAGRYKDGRERKYTNCVVTRWYRPPELLLGARQYGGEIDIWGIGCVIAEMYFRRPILPGNSDLDQCEKIWNLCGSPNQQNWPHHDKLPGCEGKIRFTPRERKLRELYVSLATEAIDLLDRLLTLDPRERLTASQALDHDYFWSDPLPADPKTLPTYESSHEFDQRGRRQPNPITFPEPNISNIIPNHIHLSNGFPQPMHGRNKHQQPSQQLANPYQHRNALHNFIPPVIPPASHLPIHLPLPPISHSWQPQNSRAPPPIHWGQSGLQSSLQSNMYNPIPSVSQRSSRVPLSTERPSHLPPRPPGLPERPPVPPTSSGRGPSFNNKQRRPTARPDDGGPSVNGLNYG